MIECPEIQYLNSLLIVGLDNFNSREIKINTVNNDATTITDYIKEVLYIKRV